MSDGVDVYAAGTQLAGVMCWVCQTRIMAGDEIVFCPHDQLPTHAECWENNEGCPVYGCEAAPDHGHLAVQALGSQTGAANYQCPSCRRMVKPNFLQCNYCGVDFSLQNVVSGLENEDYKYRGQHDHRQQRGLWLLLLCTITGILAPIALILCATLMMKGSMGRLRLSHLFRDSRMLFYGTFTLSAVTTILLLVLIAFDL